MFSGNSKGFSYISSYLRFLNGRLSLSVILYKINTKVRSCNWGWGNFWRHESAPRTAHGGNRASPSLTVQNHGQRTNHLKQPFGLGLGRACASGPRTAPAAESSCSALCYNGHVLQDHGQRHLSTRLLGFRTADSVPPPLCKVFPSDKYLVTVEPCRTAFTSVVVWEAGSSLPPPKWVRTKCSSPNSLAEQTTNIPLDWHCGLIQRDFQRPRSFCSIFFFWVPSRAHSPNHPSG